MYEEQPRNDRNNSNREQKLMISFDTKDTPQGKQTRLKVEPEDLVALGVVLLAFGALLVAVIVAVGLVIGKVQESSAIKIILGCVGGSAIAGVAAKLIPHSKSRH